jgi:serine/threonine protein kinase
VLGQGGFDITYLALGTNLNKQVAIKEYLPIELAVREESSTVRPFIEDRRKQYGWGLTRFIDEARMLAALDHGNIVRVHSVFEDNATA